MSIKKVAQFGGVGGGGNGAPFSPGRSPIGRGGMNPGGHQINENWDEKATTEDRLKSARQNDFNFDDSDKNIEARHMFMHKDIESNKNYILSPEERRLERFRAQLHEYNEQLKAHANSLDTYSVQYLKANAYMKDEDLVSFDMLLSKSRHFDDSKKRVFEYEDKVPDTIQPERSHPVLSNRQLERIAIIVTRDQITEQNDPDVEERSVFDIARKTIPPIGRTPVLDINVDEYITKLRQQYTPQTEGLLEMKDNMPDYPDPDTLPTHINPNDVSKKTIPYQPNLEKSPEGILHPNKTPKNLFDRNNMAEDEEDLGHEAMDVTEVYDGSQWFGAHSPASFSY